MEWHMASQHPYGEEGWDGVRLVGPLLELPGLPWTLNGARAANTWNTSLTPGVVVSIASWSGGT